MVHPRAKGKRKLESVAETKTEDKKESLIEPLAESKPLVDKEGGYSVILSWCDTISVSRIRHQTGLTAKQVEAIEKLKGTRGDTKIELTRGVIRECRQIHDWMYQPCLDFMTQENRLALNSGMSEVQYLRGLFTKETKLGQWNMQGKDAIDFLYICYS